VEFFCLYQSRCNVKSKRAYSFALWMGLAAMFIFSGAARADLIPPGTTGLPFSSPPSLDFCILRCQFCPFYKGLQDFSRGGIQSGVFKNPFLPSRKSCPGCTLDASLNSGPITVSNGQGITLTFDVVSAVYSDPSNVFGAGNLDFVYQVTNVSGNDLIGRLTAGVFSGFMTDVGFTATGSILPGGLFVDGTQAPQLVNRSTAVNNGATVGFIYYAPMSSTFAPGTTSTALIIETDAKNFKTGNVNVIDDVVGSTAAFEPASAVAAAEPSSVALMLLGLGLVFVLRKRIGQGLPQTS
jgi:hypothetical protein